MAPPSLENVASSDRREPLDLAAAFAELQNLLLDRPDVTDFLNELAVLAAATVPGTHCGITMRRDGHVVTVVSSDEIALRLDELQYLRGRGPCLQAIRDSVRIEVPDVSNESRWGDYGEQAAANGVHCIVAIPLTVDGATVGALNLFAADPHAFAPADVERAEAFARQASTALTILLRQARHTVLDDEVREALATRAVIDQALGILMVTREITSQEAFEILRHSSQNTNRKVSAIAAELIEAMTGHPPLPPRPLSERT
jgi:GAF domain-containing protein